MPTSLAPSQDTSHLQTWLEDTARAQPMCKMKSWITLVQLAWWTVWKEGNTRIFQNTAATLRTIHARIIDETKSWRDAGGLATCYRDQGNLISEACLAVAELCVSCGVSWPHSFFTKPLCFVYFYAYVPCSMKADPTGFLCWLRYCCLVYIYIFFLAFFFGFFSFCSFWFSLYFLYSL
jgi:hypothetical protein